MPPLKPKFFCTVYVTAPSISVARTLSRNLLKEKLIACANIIPGVESHYEWNGKRVKDKEVILFLKTQSKHYKKIEQFILKHHPYKIPCVLSWELSNGHGLFLSWIKQNT